MDEERCRFARVGILIVLALGFPPEQGLAPSLRGPCRIDLIQDAGQAGFIDFGESADKQGGLVTEGRTLLRQDRCDGGIVRLEEGGQ